MKEFNFDKFEKHLPEFTARLKEQMQTRCFNPIAPDFEVEVNVFEQGRGYGKRISVLTTDITKHMNFNMFAEIRLHNFGGSVSGDGDSLYWLPIDWRYEHKSGGSNGCQAFIVMVNDDGEIVEVRD